MTYQNVDEEIYVGIGEIAIGYENTYLRIPSLGSCIGLIIYPNIETNRVAVMGHIMLPKSHDSPKRDNRWGPAKYADKGVPLMISKLLKERQVHKKDLVAKMVGGSHMFGHTAITLRIGEMNEKAVRNILKEHKIPILRSFTGGDTGTMVKFKVKDYQLIVRPTGSQAMEI